jgi:hypothetical protein
METMSGETRQEDTRRICAIVRSLGLPRNEVAHRLEIETERFERFCNGAEPVPRVVLLAVERLLDIRLADDIVARIRDPERLCDA